MIPKKIRIEIDLEVPEAFRNDQMFPYFEHDVTSLLQSCYVHVERLQNKNKNKNKNKSEVLPLYGKGGAYLGTITSYKENEDEQTDNNSAVLP